LAKALKGYLKSLIKDDSGRKVSELKGLRTSATQAYLPSHQLFQVRTDIFTVTLLLLPSERIGNSFVPLIPKSASPKN
jgi:hypothetical protein